MKFHITDYNITNSNELDTPALAIYADKLDHNIAQAIKMVGDASRLRPHIKTCKSPDVVRIMLEKGIHKFKCATIAEAEILGQCGAGDVLFAYPLVGPKIRRFIQLIKKYPQTKYTCLADNAGAAMDLTLAFSRENLTVPVYIDLNVGQNRTGILPEKAFALYRDISNMQGLHPVGIHAYDGHIRDADFTKRKTNCDSSFKVVKALSDHILANGFPAPKIIAGGSPTFPVHAEREGVECSPGTFVFWDKGYADLCPEQPFVPAALLLSRVIALPDATKICLDLGHKSVAAENSLPNRVYFPEHPALVPIGQSEEHLVLEAGTGHGHHIGDLLYGIPFHICPTVALYEAAHFIEKGRAIGKWRITARDRVILV